MHGEGDVLEHDEGVSDGDASQEEVDWAEMEKPAKYYPPASASLSALLFGAKNCHTRIKQYVGCICRIAELLVRFKIRLLFHSCDRVPHISVAEDEDVEDVEEDAKEADDHRKVQVDVVVEILPKNT